MKKLTFFTFITFFLALIAVSAASPEGARAETIKVSPKVVVLDYYGTRVTIHTDIPVGSVDREDIFLEVNGGGPLYPCSVYSDLRGNLVVKFLFDDLRSYLSAPSALFTLNGSYTDGSAFSAEEVVSVR